MALGDPYISVNQLKEHVNQPVGADDEQYLATLVGAVSRQIEHHCGRQFNDAGTTSARVYRPTTDRLVIVDDFSTDTGLIVAVDNVNDGTYAKTVANYNLEPTNGIRHGRTGWPYNRIETFSGDLLPLHTYRPGVRVTARWGWAAVPADVVQAALIQAARVYQRRYSPGGLVGQGDFVFRVSGRPDPDVVEMLSPYTHEPLVA